MARINFRQGIVRHQTNSNNDPLFLSRSGNNANLIISPDHTVISFIHGTKDYLYTEPTTVLNAWTNIPTGKDSWLYWELDRITGIRTFGHTDLIPIQQSTEPTNPAVGQMWFNTANNNNKWYVFAGSAYIETIRVLAAKMIGGTTFASVSINAPLFTGTQIGNNDVTNTGSLVFDSDGRPIINQDGSFFTTEDIFTSGVPTGASLKINNIIVRGKATQPMGAYQVVQFTQFGIINPASPFDFVSSVYGIIEADVAVDDIANVITDGVIFNETWDWEVAGATINDPIFIDSTGRLTLVNNIPNQVAVGAVIGKQEILFKLGVYGFEGSTGITDHGDLVGLGDDDHPQYINEARGDIRYSPVIHDHLLSGVAALKSATSAININASAAPTTGQILTALDSSNATWQDPVGDPQTPWLTDIDTAGFNTFTVDGTTGNSSLGVNITTGISDLQIPATGTPTHNIYLKAGDNTSGYTNLNVYGKGGNIILEPGGFVGTGPTGFQNMFGMVEIRAYSNPNLNHPATIGTADSFDATPAQTLLIRSGTNTYSGTGGAAGDIQLQGGYSAKDNGGSIYCYAGDAGDSTNGVGGVIKLVAGSTTSPERGSDITIQSGSGPVAGGKVFITTANSGGIYDTGAGYGNANIVLRSGNMTGAGSEGSNIKLIPGLGVGTNAFGSVQIFGANNAGNAVLDLFSGSFKTVISVPVLTNDTIFTLPPNNGGAGDILTTNGFGVTSWVTPGTGASQTPWLTDIDANGFTLLTASPASGINSKPINIQTGTADTASSGDILLTVGDNTVGVGDGGNIILTSGSQTDIASNFGGGGNIELIAGNTAALYGVPGSLLFTAGDVSANEITTGGGVNITSGSNLSVYNGAASGNISISTPDATTTGVSGNILITTGSTTWNSVTATGSNVQITSGDGYTGGNVELVHGTGFGGPTYQGAISIASSTSTNSGRLIIKQGTNYTEISVPTLTANTLFQLPSINGNAGEVLSTDGSGVTSWVAVASNNWLTANAGIDFNNPPNSTTTFGNQNNIALGQGAVATASDESPFGASAIAIGTGAYISTGSSAIAIGTFAYCADIQSLAIGTQAYSIGTNEVVIGPFASTSTPSTDSIVIGRGSNANKIQQTVVGQYLGSGEVSVDVDYSVKIGYAAGGSPTDKNMLHLFSKGKLELYGAEAQFVLPNYTTAEIAIPLPGVSGGLVFDTDTSELKAYDGAAWNAVGGSSNNWIQANNGNDFSIGPNSGANGNNNIALGYNARALGGVGSISIGTDTKSYGPSTSISFGYKAFAYGIAGIAIGADPTAQGHLDICIGRSATTRTGTKNILIGAYADLGGTFDSSNNILIGTRTKAGQSTQRNILIGENVEIVGTYTDQVMIGSGVTTGAVPVDVNYSVKLGYAGVTVAEKNLLHLFSKGKLELYGAEAQFVLPNYTTAEIAAPLPGVSGGLVYDTDTSELKAYDGATWNAVGGSSNNWLTANNGADFSTPPSAAVNNIAIGNNARANLFAANDIAIGLDAYATTGSSNSIVIGRVSQSSSFSGIAVGYSANAGGGNRGIAIGHSAGTTAAYALAIGANADADGSKSIALGSGASSPNSWGIAIGSPATVSGNAGIAIGYAATAVADAVAISDADATGNNGISIGRFSLAFTAAVGIGYYGRARSARSIAIGRSDVAASATQGIGIGTSTNVLLPDQVAIGSGLISTNVATDVAYSVKLGYGPTGVDKNLLHLFSKGKLELYGDEAQFVLPNYTTAEIAVPLPGVSGGLVYDTDTSELKAYDGAAWNAVGATTLAGLSDVTITAPAKGDLFVNSGTSWIDVTVGTDGQVLAADSAQVSGVAWVDNTPPTVINTQTGTTYTLALTDRNAFITMDNVGANTLTVDANTTVAFPIGSVVKVNMLGAGVTTIAITTDTINGVTNGTLPALAQYQVATLTKITATVWNMSVA